MNKLYSTIFAALLFVVLLWVGCSNNEVAGGVSEETNTIAGILVDQKGSPVVSAKVYCKSINVDTLESSDETNSKGEFSLPVKLWGSYGISASVDSLAFYEVVEFKGKDVELNTATLKETADISGRVMLRDDSTAAGITMRMTRTHIRSIVSFLQPTIIAEQSSENTRKTSFGNSLVITVLR